MRAHDRGAIETSCYADVVRPDAVTERLQGLADHWRSTFGRSEEALAAEIRADRIDILVDLTGHTAHNHLPVFARRPAPRASRAKWKAPIASCGGAGAINSWRRHGGPGSAGRR